MAILEQARYLVGMHNTSSIELKRDCPATQIPSGNAVVLPAGSEVYLTQSLGGSFTVEASGGLFRISSQEAEALGLSPVDTQVPPSSEPSSSTGPLQEEQVWNTLRTCYDPEIPVNIVDLGLVYDLRIEPLGPGKSRVDVKMTLTAPGCGMGPAIAADAQQRILDLPGVGEAAVDIVWDPPWHHSMISPAGRAALGLDQ